MSHFQNILNNLESSNKLAQDKMLKNIPSIITKEDNKTLNKPISMEEVKVAIFSMHPDKSPRPDGFYAFFFQKCWEIIGMDLWKAIEATRNGGLLIIEINHTFLTLIPKTNFPKSPKEFRPIALCNIVYKILSKILSSRIKPLLPKLISEEQTCFVPGRSILDGILIIKEAIHSSSKRKIPSMLIKLDIQKAYDMVDWRFLCKTLEAFDFSHQWINLIYQCISMTKMSILINRTPEGFFDTSRGIRQGDPLSPFIFIIMAKAFGIAFSKAQLEGKIKGISVTDNVPNITHQKYADDTFLPSESSLHEASNIMLIIQSYSDASGQKINVKKSEIFFINTNPIMEKKNSQLMGFKIGKIPCKYLGIEQENRNKHIKVWNQILSKLDSKIGGWKDKWLTRAGKIMKIRAVLSALPLYPISCLPLPKSINNKLEGKLRNFLWKNREEEKKISLIKWDKISNPKELEGLGIKKLNWKNEALGAKLS